MITYTISRHQGHRQYALSNRHGPETFRLTSTEDGRFRWSKEVHEPDNLYRDIVEEETDHLTAQSLWPKMARHLGIPTRETEVAITSEQVKNWLRDHAGMTRYTLAQNKILSSAEWKLADAIQKLNSLDHQTRHSEKAREAMQKAEEAQTALAALANSHVQTAQEPQS